MVPAPVVGEGDAGVGSSSCSVFESRPGGARAAPGHVAAFAREARSAGEVRSLYDTIPPREGVIRTLPGPTALPVTSLRKENKS